MEKEKEKRVNLVFDSESATKFVRAWQTSQSIVQVATKLGLSVEKDGSLGNGAAKALSSAAVALRKRGIPLRKFAGGRKGAGNLALDIDSLKRVAANPEQSGKK